jgi:hypothetical protein
MIPAMNNFLVIISHHGELWIISDNKTLMNDMYDLFDKNGATVIKCSTLRDEHKK